MLPLGDFRLDIILAVVDFMKVTLCKLASLIPSGENLTLNPTRISLLCGSRNNYFEDLIKLHEE